MIDFATDPSRYRHWKLTVEGDIAVLALDVQENGGLAPGYALKLNSYDLGVDIELHDAIQRLRFEQPQVGAVIVTSAKDRVFSAGANIAMLGHASHGHKVNFCKFTNETRNAMEDASHGAGPTFLAAINGTAAGGGYELALATEHLILSDDGSSAVSLPEVPLLAVLPGTGGLTRLVDKRKVRRDRADFFCTLTEGIKGKRAVEWRLVDELAPRSRLMEVARERARALVKSNTPARAASGIVLPALERSFSADVARWSHVEAKLDRGRGVADITVSAPVNDPPRSLPAIHAAGAAFWPLALARELDDAILHLRLNEPEIGIWVLRTSGSAARVAACDHLLAEHAEDWLVRETTQFLKRVFKRLDVSARSMIALIEPGTCFTGTLFELALAADRSYMLAGTRAMGPGGDNRPAPIIGLTDMNFGALPMCNGLTRLETRFLGAPEQIAASRAEIGRDIGAEAAEALGLVTFAPDDIDWDDEVRVALEERQGFSPDALTGMEANLRFAGPETLETKIFGRLSAWQNWIFQRPNAVGEAGALKLYGTGRQAQFDKSRV
ncbi:MAG: benzoyl-CoA-dihydrodiol lyase [Alphaproteobacteria bacterium]|nr:benzoyl-CoA-dihydrodiol lyase [Alphaproteobacteria bacterium]